MDRLRSTECSTSSLSKTSLTLRLLGPSPPSPTSLGVTSFSVLPSLKPPEGSLLGVRCSVFIVIDLNVESFVFTSRF